MMLNAVTRVAMVPFKASVNPQSVMLFRVGGSSVKTQQTSILNSPAIRSFRTNALLNQANNDNRQFIRRARERVGLKDRAMGPTSGAPFQIGQGLVAGASVFGIGALCYYGLGMSSEATGNNAYDRSMVWPEYVRQRIRETYLYFGSSLVFTVAGAAATFRSPAMINLMMKNSWMAILGTMAAMIGTGMVARSLPYKEGFGAKQVAWMVHSGVVGAVLAPLCFLGGPLLMRAAYMTAGVVGGLSAIAVCAPSEKFLNMGGPLAMGLGVVFASSIGSMFVPAGTALGAGLYSVAMYGGLILFSGFLLFDTQRIIRAAETIPPNSVAVFDPINASISIYMDTINIFVRIAQMLAMGGNRRK